MIPVRKKNPSKILRITNQKKIKPGIPKQGLVAKYKLKKKIKKI